MYLHTLKHHLVNFVIVDDLLIDSERIGSKEYLAISCPQKGSLDRLLQTDTSDLLINNYMFLLCEIQMIIFSLPA